jgi:myosin heavy subunit
MEFANNSACVELLEGKGVSVMAVLADEVRTKNGSDQGFLDKLYLAQSKSLYFEKPRMKDGTFTIKHYAQTVIYTATGFVEKNRNKVCTRLHSRLLLARIATRRFVVPSDATLCRPART